MTRGLGGIAKVSDTLMEIGVDASNLAFNLTWHDWLNLRSLCDISEVIAKAAIGARELARCALPRGFPGCRRDGGEHYFTVARQTGFGVEVTTRTRAIQHRAARRNDPA